MKYPHTTQKLILSTLSFGLLLPAVAHSAAIEYGVAGSTYNEDFDFLSNSSGAWTAGETIPGWHWVNGSGSVPTAYTGSGGSSSAQSQILNLGNSSDRAFGAQNGNGIETIFYGVQIRNTTGSTLDSFSLSYTGEQWRVISNEGLDQLTFEYQIFESGTTDPFLVTTGWTNVESLDFIAPRTTSGSSTSLDGNDDANQETISSTVSGLAWGDGQELWLRWTDNNPVDNDASGGSLRAMMGIDDVSFSAAVIPEPSTYAALFGALSLGFAAVIRRRAKTPKGTRH